jgi:hypothetical protein
MFLDSSDVFDVFVNMKKQAYLQPQPSGGPPVLGLTLFFLSSYPLSAMNVSIMKAEVRPLAVRTIWSACVTTRLIRFRLLSYLYITGIRIAFLNFSYPWLDAQLSDLAYASVDSTVLWQNEYLPPPLV